MRPIGKTCERAREWTSLRLDDELSELGAARLTAHLKRCPSCRSFASEVEAVSLQLRAAPLERLSQPIALPSRRRALGSLRLVQFGAAAALVAAAAGLGTLFGALGSGGQQSAFRLPSASGAAAVEVSPRGLPTTRQIALLQKPPLPIPRSLALPDV